MKLLDPHVSVIVPVHDAARDIAGALASLSAQTFRDFEIVVVDDASTDETALLVQCHPDVRIRLVRHETRRGLAAARATGVEHARGEILALLDADAHAMPYRLEAQVLAFAADPALQLVGSHLAVATDAGRDSGIVWRRPLDPDAAACELLFRDALSGVALRRAAWPGETCRLPAASEYWLNARVAASGKVANIDRALTRVRMRRTARDRAGEVLAEASAREIMREQIRRLGIEPTERELMLNRHIGVYNLPASVTLLHELEAWLLKLFLANHATRRYPERAFCRSIGREWYEVCKFAAPIGREALQVWRASPLVKHWLPSRLEYARFLARCLLRREREGSAPAALT